MSNPEGLQTSNYYFFQRIQETFCPIFMCKFSVDTEKYIRFLSPTHIRKTLWVIGSTLAYEHIR